MTENDARPDRPDWTVLSRVSADFASLSRQMAQMSSDLTDMHATLVTRPRPQQPQQPQPQPQPQSFVPPTYPPSMAPPSMPPPPMAPPPMAPPPMPPRPTPAPAPPRPAPEWLGRPQQAAPARPSLIRRAASATDGRLVGTILAVAGVGVTLVGVVLLLVLAAQAGILRPEVRVGAGALLAAALVAVGMRAHRRGSRIGAIAPAATGVATAYLDIVAATRIYHWLPAVAGLVVAGIVAAAGLGLARRWDSEHLALLVLTPLIGLAPFVTGGIDLPLIGFMLVLSAVTLPIGVGTDWVALNHARVAAASIWLIPALVTVHLSATAATTSQMWALAAGCLVAAGLSIGGTVLTSSRHSAGPVTALVSAAGTLPVLLGGIAIDRPIAAGTIGLLAIGLLVLVSPWVTVTGMTEPLRTTWTILSAIAALVAIPTAFGAVVSVPVLIGLALVVTVLGRDDRVLRGIGFALSGIGVLAYLAAVPVESLVHAVDADARTAVSTAVAGLLLVVTALATPWVVASARGDQEVQDRTVLWMGAGAVALYGMTATAVTLGVAVGGTTTGFLAGHMVATIVWVVAAGVALVAARKVPAGPARVAPIAGALALAAAAVGKLIAFDLATLDGGFRVGAFIVVGLVLLTLGARWARQESAVPSSDEHTAGDHSSGGVRPSDVVRRSNS